MRRALTIFAILIILLGVGVGVYFYIASQQASLVVTPTDTTAFPSAGQTVTPVTPSDTGTVGASTTPITSTPGPAPARLVKVSPGPIVPGAVVVNMPAKSASSSPDTAIYYIERQSGNVFTYLTGAGTMTRISNKTLPGIQEASWLKDGSTAFVRYLSGTDSGTINTYALPSSGTGGFFLSQNLSGIAVASSSILTLVSGINGSNASVMRTDGTRSASAFTTPLSSLRVSFAGPGHYLAFTKPSASLAGAAFVVDRAGVFTRIAGPRNGLVALASPSGKWVLVSYVATGAMQMELVNTATNETVSLPVATIADKCVWAADSSAAYCGIPSDPSTTYSYPDDWYQGAVHFSDRIWKIQVADRYAQLILDFSKESNGSLDATALAIDPLSTTLAFLNKNDGSLWSYRF